MFKVGWRKLLDRLTYLAWDYCRIHRSSVIEKFYSLALPFRQNMLIAFSELFCRHILEGFFRSFLVAARHYLAFLR
jgi:hypothetical protein